MSRISETSRHIDVFMHASHRREFESNLSICRSTHLHDACLDDNHHQHALIDD